MKPAKSAAACRNAVRCPSSGRQAGRERGRRRRFSAILDERHGLAGAVQHHLGQEAALAAGQAFAQPAIDNFGEGEVGLGWIHDACARIDVGNGPPDRV